MATGKSFLMSVGVMSGHARFGPRHWKYPQKLRHRGNNVSRIKVLVVDDSAVVRQVVSNVLAADPDIEVIGAVADPILAIARMNVQWPDVLVLDVEMPRMDGITFLKKIMAEHPTPVVICSTLAVPYTHLWPARRTRTRRMAARRWRRRWRP